MLLEPDRVGLKVARVFGANEILPPQAVPLYQGHQIASRLITSDRSSVKIAWTMRNPTVKKPEVGLDIFRVVCGDGMQISQHDCGSPEKSRSAWSWVTAKLLQTKLHAVAKNSRGKLEAFQHRFCGDDVCCTNKDIEAPGSVVISSRPTPFFPLGMFNTGRLLQDMGEQADLARGMIQLADSLC